jgi:hypothetical protein
MPTFTQIGAAQTVGAGGAAFIEFTSIPSTFTDLVIKFSLRDNTSGGGVSNNLFVRFNNSGGTAYSGRLLYGSGSSALSGNNGSNAHTIFQYVTSSGSTANTFSNGEIYIPNYLNSTQKVFNADSVTETNGNAAITGLSVGLWNNTSAITSITLTPASGSLVQHSTAYLYGISNT